MKLFRFDPEVARTIDQYASSGFALARVAYLSGEAVVHCAHLAPNGLIGYHQAAVPQLFLVLQGEGWVRGESPARTSIKGGQAAFWQKDEWHESGTVTGMTVILIEGVGIDPAKLMPPV